MYPDFQYLLQSMSGVEVPAWLAIFKTFGLFVALAFLSSAVVLTKEIRRKEEQGLLLPEFSTIVVGKPASTSELLWSAFFGFLIGFKIGGFFGNWATISPNPMAYMFSPQGSLLPGIAGALIMAYARYYEKKKQLLPQPQEKRTATYPHQRVSEFVVAAAISGLIGAKFFNAFESWDEFIKNPIENLVSSSGLTFYGGLITAAVVIALYARKHNISIRHLADCFAPALMLAYGLGRLGCHFAGDGDWGVFNSAYVSTATGALRHAAPSEFLTALHIDPNYLAEQIRQFGSIDKIPHLYRPAPAWLPDWVFAMNYPHNVNHEGVLIQGCAADYCTVLPVGVFPTSLYEAIICTMLFLVLWKLRHRINQPLHISGVYLILNGLERFFIEKVKVNYKYDWGFIHPAQSEIIAVVLMLAGLCILLFYRDEEISQQEPLSPVK